MHKHSFSLNLVHKKSESPATSHQFAQRKKATRWLRWLLRKLSIASLLECLVEVAWLLLVPPWHGEHAAICEGVVVTFVTSLLRLILRRFVTLMESYESSSLWSIFRKVRELCNSHKSNASIWPSLLLPVFFT
jgi:hypothetical protein